MANQALAGLKVIEFGNCYAGPYCARALAGFGAEVVKVEPPETGDPARSAGPFPADGPHSEKGALFLYLNTGKKSVTLNLNSAEGRRIAVELIRQADVLIDSFEARVMPAFGLDYPTLARENPRLVMTSITTFGQTGPYRDYKGPPMVASALGGLLYQNGKPGQEPLKDGGWQPEFAAAWYGVVGTMAALHARRVTGRGQHVDVSVMESGVTCHHYNTVLYTYMNHIKKRNGNRSDRSHPLTVYPTSDGYIAISANSPDQWEALCLLLDVPELLEKGGYETGRSRMRYADEIDAVIVPWTSGRTKMDIFHTCQERRIPAVPIYDIGEVLQDTHYNLREFWVTQEHPVAGEIISPGAPFRMGETPWQEGRAPLLGEHNQEVYGTWLGRNAEDLAALRRIGAI